MALEVTRSYDNSLFVSRLKSKWKAVWKENLAVGQGSILLGFYSTDSPLLFLHGIQIVSQEHLNWLHCLIPYL